MTMRDMIEQSHPEDGQRLVVKIDMVVRGEVEKPLTHARERGGQREFVEITQGHRHVRDMGELGRRNRGRLKCLDQNFDFGVV